MSTKAAGTHIDKLIKTFERMDIDEKVKAFESLKEILTTALDERAKDLKTNSEKYEKLKESIK